MNLFGMRFLEGYDIVVIVAGLLLKKTNLFRTWNAKAFE